GIALYDPHQHRGLAARYSGHDPGVCCRDQMAVMLWLLGYPEQALNRSREALALARELSHAYSYVFALIWAGRVHSYRCEAGAAYDCLDTAVTLAAEQRFDRWMAAISVLRGRLLVATRRPEEGLDQMHRGLAAGRRLGSGAVDAVLARAMLAEACLQVGDIE